MLHTNKNTIQKAVEHIRPSLPFDRPDAAVILGSGLGDFARQIEHSVQWPYSDIPGLPGTTVQGHSGTLIAGYVNGKAIIAFAGRFHSYEGHPLERTILPVQIAYELHSPKLIISNAAGGINPYYEVGDLMLINDILSMNKYAASMGLEHYSYTHYHYINPIKKIAAGLGIGLQNGVYLFAPGPNYETKAEIKAFTRIGGDAVGMSTAPELWEASRLNLPAAGISLITNAAAGLSSQKLSHDEIKQAAELRKKDFARLVTELVSRSWE